MTLQEVMLLEAVLFLGFSGILSMTKEIKFSKSIFLFGVINLLGVLVLVVVDWIG